jgi:hypothetical protein
MMTELEREYRALLAREGLEHLLAPPAPETVRAYVEGLGAQEREYLGADVITPVGAGGHVVPAGSPFADVDAGIRRTLIASGVDVPGDTYVGEFPHRSFNAQAWAVPGGTLILLNTGLRGLLDRVATTMVASQLTFSQYGSVHLESPTPQQRQRRAEADAALAEAVLAYVCQTEPRPASPPRYTPDPQGAFGFFMARSAERFAIGHEYAHLLAGHLHTPPDGTEENRRREYEADELAAMLILRGVDESSEFVWRALAVAGPFLFLAVHHLVTRVRDAIYDIPDGVIVPSHPPSDERAAVLREILERLGERSLLQFGEAWVSSLSLHEPMIVEYARSSAPH